MKKFMTLMLGLSLVLGSTALFASGKDTTKKEKKAKKSKAKKTAETK